MKPLTESERLRILIEEHRVECINVEIELSQRLLELAALEVEQRHRADAVRRTEHARASLVSAREMLLLVPGLTAAVRDGIIGKIDDLTTSLERFESANR